MPLGRGHGIFHPRFSERNRPVAASTMTATCQITRQAGAGTTNPETGVWSPPARTVIYTGRCRINAATVIGGEKVHDVGSAQETIRRYNVAVEWECTAKVGDEIVLLTGVDPALAGVRMRVVSAEFASEQWQRDLMAEEVEAIR